MKTFTLLQRKIPRTIYFNSRHFVSKAIEFLTENSNIEQECHL